MTKLIKLTSHHVVVGQRPPFDILHSDGKLMLLRGGLIASEQVAETLREHGYRRQKLSRPQTVFSSFARIFDRLSLVFQDILEKQTFQGWNIRIRSLAGDLLELTDSDPDAAFASAHLNTLHSYLVVHSVMAAVVTARLGLANNLSRNDQLTLVQAALTHDIGLLFIQDEINASQTLSKESRQKIRQHADKSVTLLKSFGVEDKTWLEAVENHHERLDGSGYQGKQSNEFSFMARILGLADVYSAMLRPRPHRDRFLARQALEKLYGETSDQYDGYLIETLIWDFGFFPPGSMLRLANREMAVAVRNIPGLLDSPHVASLTDAQGRHLTTPIIRDSNEEEFAIVSTLDPSLASRSGRNIERCWSLQTCGM